MLRAIGGARPAGSRRHGAYFGHAREAHPAQSATERRRHRPPTVPCRGCPGHNGRVPGPRYPAVDPDHPRPVHRGRCPALHPDDATGLARRHGLRVRHRRRLDRPVRRLDRTPRGAEPAAVRHRLHGRPGGPPARSCGQRPAPGDAVGLRAPRHRTPRPVDAAGQRRLSGGSREGRLPLRRSVSQLGVGSRRSARGRRHVLDDARRPG